VLIVPIDLQAPKGRLILPQVQTLRALLDNDAVGTVVKESEYAAFLAGLNRKPNLVICDSQVVDLMVRRTPAEIPATTFSILFARYKGDLETLLQGAAAIDTLKEGGRVLIAEACTHHPLEDDIGRIKIPRWIEAYRGYSLQWDIAAGKDFPADLADYDLVIHCGGCMLNRRGMLSRLEQAAEAGVPVTNYGLAIAAAHGHLQRVTACFAATERSRLRTA
jgi:[FeFe] hydrogenase H-cluster maturation GTPase HydF